MNYRHAFLAFSNLYTNNLNKYGLLRIYSSSIPLMANKNLNSIGEA